MRTRERLEGLKNWLEANLCAGREMKAPGETVQDLQLAEPRVFLGWTPGRPDETGELRPDPVSAAPGILVMPGPSRGKLMEDKRFDRYNGVKRPQDLGQSLAVSILLTVYEPGIRLPGFVGSGTLDKLREGTEAGLFALYDWIDDLVSALLTVRSIPGTDLMVDEESILYSPYTDQSYVVDKRPLYYGFVNVEFGCYAATKTPNIIEEMLS